jgi:hypothetical protein
MSRLQTLALLTTLATCQAGIAGAQVVGSAALKGPLRFAVKKCGTDRGRAQLGIAVAPDGTWMAASDEGSTLTGTSQPLGASGRKLTIAFDDGSAAAFAADQASEIANMRPDPH